MKKIIILIATMLSCLLVTTVLADEKYMLTFEGKDKLYTSHENFFETFGTVLPGGSYEETISISNESNATCHFFFKSENIALSEQENSLLEKINLIVKRNANEEEIIIYEGNLAYHSENYEPLMNLTGFEKGEFIFTINISETIDNEAALKKIRTKWWFALTAKETLGEMTVPAIPLGEKENSSTKMIALFSGLIVIGILFYEIFNRKRRRRVTFIVMCLFLVRIMPIAYGYVSDFVERDNQVFVKNNDISIVEQFDPEPVRSVGDIFIKEPTVKNENQTACFVRIYVSYSDERAKEAFLITANQADWRYGEDGFYYYKHLLEVGETTTPLFSDVKILDHSLWKESKTVHLDVIAESCYPYGEMESDAWNYVKSKR